jgi:hypothetical protein
LAAPYCVRAIKVCLRFIPAGITNSAA